MEFDKLPSKTRQALNNIHRLNIDVKIEMKTLERMLGRDGDSIVTCLEIAVVCRSW